MPPDCRPTHWWRCALEGASRRATSDRILAAVREYAAALGSARLTLGDSAASDEIVSAAGVIVAGVAPQLRERLSRGASGRVVDGAARRARRSRCARRAGGHGGCGVRRCAAAWRPRRRAGRAPAARGARHPGRSRSRRTAMTGANPEFAGDAGRRCDARSGRAPRACDAPVLDDATTRSPPSTKGASSTHELQHSACRAAQLSLVARVCAAAVRHGMRRADGRRTVPSSFTADLTGLDDGDAHGLGHGEHGRRLGRESVVQVTLPNGATFSGIVLAADRRREHDLVHPLGRGTARWGRIWPGRGAAATGDAFTAGYACAGSTTLQLFIADSGTVTIAENGNPRDPGRSRSMLNALRCVPDADASRPWERRSHRSRAGAHR